MSDWEASPLIALFGGFATAACILVVQFVVFLRNGAWPSWSLLSPLRWLGVGWAHDPGSWFGLYRLLDRMPVSAGVFLLSLLLSWGLLLLFGSHSRSEGR